MAAVVRLLQLEDSLVDYELIIATLEADGFTVESRRTTTRAEFLAALEQGGFEVILADCKLPAFDGLAALDLARQHRPETPFLFVSGFIGEEAALESLKNGATDYVFKHNLARLAPAVRRALQQAREQQERRKAEAALQEREATLASFFDTAPFMMGVVELLPDDLVHLSDNAASARFLGTSPEKMRGRRASQLGFPKELIPKWLEHFRETSRLGRPVEAEHSFLHRGQVHWVSVTASALPGASGTPNRFCYVAADTTDKKLLEQQFLRAQRLESVGTLASGIAHDLNNVLAPIVMSLRLFRSKLPGAEDQEVLTGMEASARRGADIIRQVLTFARGAEGARHAVDIGVLISDLVKMLRDTCPRSIRIETALAPDLRMVNGDATQIYQVLMNLCVNARDAMPAGGQLRLSAQWVPAGDEKGPSGALGGEWIVVTVSDTGNGIAPEILDKIFDPFFTTKAASFGTGLGLSTALSIVKSHGGQLTVTSQVNQGTEFKVYLPLPARDAGTVATDEAPAMRAARGRGELILVVDDEPAVRLVARATLRDHGYRVLTAGDGNEARTLFQGECKAVHLVITDMMLPGMDGAGLVRSLRELSPGLKVIAMSGLLNGKTLAETPEVAPAAFLQKPFTAERLLQCVSDALG